MRKCIISTASNMTAETYKLLCEKTAEKFGCDLEFSRISDEAVIGGFILDIDGLVYDLSIAGGLEEMKKHLKGG